MTRGPDDPGEIHVHRGGAQAFPAMIAAIEAARAKVHLEIYTFDPDGWGARFIDALLSAAQRGVAVRVVVDGWGSVESARELRRLLAHPCLTLTVFNPLNRIFGARLWRNHRKVLLVDDAVAFVGGINIHDDYADNAERLGWADLALELRGGPAGELDRRLRGGRRGPSHPAISVHLAGLRGGGRLRRRYVRAIGAASEEVTIAHAYFLPDRSFVRSLTASARRGVKIRLLLAGRSDVPFAHAAQRRLYRKLLHAGVEIREWSKSNLHAKTAVIDGRTVLLGSFNLDPLSLVNLEILLEVSDRGVSREVALWIDDHLRASRPVTLDDVPATGLRAWALELLGSTLARLIQALARMAGGAPGAPPLPPGGCRRPGEDAERRSAHTAADQAAPGGGTPCDGR